VVVQKRSSLLICLNNRLASKREFLAKDTGNSNHETGDEKNTHDDESEDPLHSNGVCKKLANADGC